MPKNTRKNDTHYAYSVGRIRAIERRLLDKDKLERMIDSKSAEDALKVLVEANYGQHGSDIVSVYEYEKLLKEEHKKVYSLLKDMAPEPDVFDLFLLANDYHNAKVILKSEFSGQNGTDILIDQGSIPADKLKTMIKDRNMKEMPSTMKKAVEECIDTYTRTLDPQVIDLILDKAGYIHMREIALMSKNTFIKNLVMIMIDLVNIKIFLRIKNLKKSWDFMQKVLIPDGNISSKMFVDNLDSPLDIFIDALRFKPCGPYLEEGIENFKTSGSLTKFEKLSDNYIISFVKKAKYISLGIEPLIAYLIAKETEIKNARIIMVGKLNNISGEIIRERLRESYV